MSEHGEYLVTGSRQYRGHDPASTFEAKIPKLVEERAIHRGDIRLLRRITPSIEPGSLTLPDDWPPGPVAPQHTPMRPATSGPLQ